VPPSLTQRKAPRTQVAGLKDGRRDLGGKMRDRGRESSRNRRSGLLRMSVTPALRAAVAPAPNWAGSARVPLHRKIQRPSEVDALDAGRRHAPQVFGRRLAARIRSSACCICSAFHAITMLRPSARTRRPASPRAWPSRSALARRGSRAAACASTPRGSAHAAPRPGGRIEKVVQQVDRGQQHAQLHAGVVRRLPARVAAVTVKRLHRGALAGED
jgi:hypothetical protein